MPRWVTFEDHTAVLESEYRKRDDLQARPAKDFTGVWDDETQALEPGKPKAARAAAAADKPKTDD